jgi:protein SCO1/2
MNSPSRTILIVSLLAIALAGGWLLSQSLSSRTAAPEHATRLPEPMPLPDFLLSDQDGNPVDRDYFRGHWTMVFFGFTHCPDICPATLQIMSAARQRLAEEDSDAVLPEILLISIDPDRDTTDLLKQYVGHFGEAVSGATGSLDELQKLTGPIGIFFEKELTGDGNYQVAHSAQIIVIDDEGRYAAVFGAPHTVEKLAQDMPRISGAL